MQEIRSTWPPEVEAAAEVSAQCCFPAAVLAGPELLLQVNEACRQFAGLASTGPEPCGKIWPEFCDQFGPRIREVLTSGRCVTAPGHLWSQHSRRQECHYEVAIVPIPLSGRGTAGVFCMLQETTAQVLVTRRMRTVRALAATEPAEDIAGLPARNIVDIITRHPADIAFAAIYRRRRGRIELLASAGLHEEEVDPAKWPIDEVLNSGAIRTIDGSWRGASRARIIPLHYTGAETGKVLVIAVNSCDSNDDVYQEFLDLIALQVDHVMALAHLRESSRTISEQSRELRRSNEELERFAYTASHDLQEPLRTVIAFTQMLARRYTGRGTPEDDENITFILEAANRMSKLIAGLLEYSRASESLSHVQAVDMKQIVQEACSNLNFAMRDSGAVFSRTDLPTVPGDPILLTQLLQNLISNAIKYRRPGVAPVIHLSAEPHSDQQWLFRLRDNGMGFEQDYAEVIFGVFKRLHGRKFPGTGIGLAVCRKIVEKHGGTIRAESQEGQGSTFLFTLPAET